MTRRVPPSVCPSIDWSLSGYAKLLDAALNHGMYTTRLFDDQPICGGDLFLRHDVDLSLEAAVVMAELEHSFGVRATYLLMNRSEFYNLDSPTGERALLRLRELGHAVGLHAVFPNAIADGRFDRVIAWHNPDPEWVHADIEDATNPMCPPWFDPETYRSDSNMRWRVEPTFREEWLQLLVHPEWWVFDGDTVQAKMAAFVDDRNERMLELLEEDLAGVVRDAPYVRLRP